MKQSPSSGGLKISVLLPSMGRPDRLVSCVEQIFDTTQDHDVEVVVVIECDKESGPALRDSESLAGKPLKIIERPFHRGPVVGWNQALDNARPDAEAFILAADDVVWLPGWLDAALAALETLPDHDGMVGFNDSFLDGSEHATHYLVTRQFLIEHLGGVMAVPYYRHYCVDMENGARAVRVGRYVWAQDAVIDHHHYSYGKMEMDHTNKLGVSWNTADLKMFYTRQAMGFPDDFMPILTDRKER